MDIIKYSRVPPRVKDLKGYISGRLTIRKIHSKGVFPEGGVVYRWLADCSCGNSVVVNGQHFLRGGIQSCGCLNQERCARAKKRYNPRRDNPREGRAPQCGRPEPINLKVEDLVGRAHVDFTGKQVGNLTVLYRTKGTLYWVPNKKSGNPTRRLVVHWMCRCSCGMSVERSSNYLTRQEVTPSCNKCSKIVNKRAAREKGGNT